MNQGVHWSRFARGPATGPRLAFGSLSAVRAPGTFMFLSTVLHALLWTTAAAGLAGDWPQYRGASHDGASPEPIRKQWSSGGPPEIWRVPCTNGLSSIAVSDGRVYTQIRRVVGTKDREVCVALDCRTGAELWAADIGSASYGGGVGSDDGPRTTPTVSGGRVYVLSSRLELHCLDAATGSPVWTRNLVNLYGGVVISWENAASPLLEDGLLLINCGAASQSLLALRATDGSLAWRSQTEGATHSTPVAATIAGVRQAIYATQSGLVSVAPATGTLLWKARYPFSYSTSLAASPLVHSNIVFISGQYNMGSFAVRVSQSGGTWNATPLWTNRNYKAHWMSPVAYDGYAYGLFGSPGSASLKCIDLLTGAQRWTRSGFGAGGTILVGDTLVVLSEYGDLYFVAATPAAYTELGVYRAINQPYDPDRNKCWNVPAIADGRIYARSTAEAVCLDVSLPGLQCLPLVVTPGGLRLCVASSNADAIDVERASRIQVRSSSSLSPGFADWKTLSVSGNLRNGLLEFDLPPPAEGQSFYIATEVP